MPCREPNVHLCFEGKQSSYYDVFSKENHRQTSSLYFWRKMKHTSSLYFQTKTILCIFDGKSIRQLLCIFEGKWSRHFFFYFWRKMKQAFLCIFEGKWSKYFLCILDENEEDISLYFRGKIKKTSCLYFWGKIRQHFLVFFYWQKITFCIVSVKGSHSFVFKKENQADYFFVLLKESPNTSLNFWNEN